MAYADPIDVEKDRRPGLDIMAPVGAPAPSVGAPTGAAAPATGGGVPASSPAAPAAPGVARGTGFIGLESYLNANRSQAQGMANRVGDAVQTQAQQALAGKGNAAAASSAAQGLTTPGGINALLGQQYGAGGGYTGAMRGFDTFLTGAVGGDRFASLANQYGGLDKYITAQPPPPSGKGNIGGGAQGKGPGVMTKPAPASGPSGGGGMRWDDPRFRNRRTV